MFDGEEGQGFAEYALILSLVFLAALVGLQALGVQIISFFSSFVEAMP